MLTISKVMQIIALLAFGTLSCLVSNSLQDEINESNNIHINTNEENINIGNTQTTNYNLQDSNYSPTQLTQVVLNVPKLKQKKLRKTRPPTIEEFAIKKRILEIYEEIRSNSDDTTGKLDHLGRIIKALNPKYIATERLRRITFFDDPDVMSPLPEIPEELFAKRQPLVLKGSQSESGLMEQLDSLAERFKSDVSWDKEFIVALSGVSDDRLIPSQVTFKRLILCLDQPNLCESLVAASSEGRIDEYIPTSQADQGSDIEHSVQRLAVKPEPQESQVQLEYMYPPQKFMTKQVHQQAHGHAQNVGVNQGLNVESNNLRYRNDNLDSDKRARITHIPSRRFYDTYQHSEMPINQQRPAHITTQNQQENHPVAKTRGNRGSNVYGYPNLDPMSYRSNRLSSRQAPRVGAAPQSIPQNDQTRYRWNRSRF